MIPLIAAALMVGATHVASAAELRHPFGVSFGKTSLNQLEESLGKADGNVTGDRHRRRIWESNPYIEACGWDITSDHSSTVDYLLFAPGESPPTKGASLLPAPLRSLRRGDSMTKTIRALASLGDPDRMSASVVHWTLKPQIHQAEPINIFAMFEVDLAKSGKPELDSIEWEYGARYEDHFLSKADTQDYTVAWGGSFDHRMIVVREREELGGSQSILYAYHTFYWVGDVQEFLDRPGYDPGLRLTLWPGAGSGNGLLIIGPRADGNWAQLLDAWTPHVLPIESVDLADNEFPVIMMQPIDEYKQPIKRHQIEIYAWSERWQKFSLITTVYRDRRFSGATRNRVKQFFAKDVRETYGSSPSHSTAEEFSKPLGIGLDTIKWPQLQKAFTGSQMTGKSFERNLKWVSPDGCIVEFSGDDDNGVRYVKVRSWRGELGSHPFPMGKLPPLLSKMRVGDSQSVVLKRLKALGRPDDRTWGVRWGFIPTKTGPWDGFKAYIQVLFNEGKLEEFRWES